MGKTVKSWVQKYSVFLLLFLAALLCLVLRNRAFSVAVVSHPDAQIAFSTGQSVLEQTWQPHVKRLAGVNIPYTATASFDSALALSLYADDGETLLGQAALRQSFREKEAGTLRFDFGTLQVVPGERYRIQLRYQNPSIKGEILIPSGSGYSGCSIDGKALGEAAAFEMIAIKNSRLFWLFAVFFPLMSFSLLCMTVWGRKWEECVGLSMMGTVFLLYVSGLFEKLQMGIMLVYVLSCVSILFSVYFYHKRGMRARDMLSPSLFLFAGLLLLILLNCSGVWYARVDEYAQWGMAAKDMFYYDSFAKHVGTAVALPRYLPFAALAEYFFVQANGLYTQELVYVAFQTTLLCAGLVLCRYPRAKWRYGLAAAATLIGIPMIFYGDVYNCIYVDPLLAVFAAYVLFCYFSEECQGFNLLRILAGLFALTTTKDMGMVIAGLLAFVMLGDSLYRAIWSGKPVSGKRFSFLCRAAVAPVSCGLFVLAVFFSWQFYMSIPVKKVAQTVAGVGQTKSVRFQSTAAASGVTLDGILGLLRHEDGGYRYQSIKNFLVLIFDGETYRFGPLALSYVDLFVLLLVCVGALGLLRFWGERFQRMLAFGVLTFWAGLCYAGVLELLYLFAFPQGGAVMLLSCDRYLASFLGGVWMAFVGLALWQAARLEPLRRETGRAAAWLLMAVMAVCVPLEGFVVKNMDVKLKEDYVYGYDEIEERLRSFSARQEKLYFVCNETGGDSAWIFRHTACPVLSPDGKNNLYASEEAYQKQVDIWTRDGEEIREMGDILSREEWGERLKGCQYVFLLHPNDVFQESYGPLFEEPDSIGDGAFYQVQKTEEGVSLSLIGKVGIKGYK